MVMQVFTSALVEGLTVSDLTYVGERFSVRKFCKNSTTKTIV